MFNEKEGRLVSLHTDQQPSPDKSALVRGKLIKYSEHCIKTLPHVMDLLWSVLENKDDG